MDLYLMIFDVLIFAAAFTVIYLYWNTPTDLPMDLTKTTTKKEGFQNIEDVINVTMCPGTTKSFVAKNGDNLCCEGNPAGTECEGVTVCTLSSTTNNTRVPSCVKYLHTYYRRKAAEVCPTELPHYFEDEAGAAFCTDGRLNKQLNGTYSTTAERCPVSKKPTYVSPSSCEVLVALDKMACPSRGCFKHALSLKKGVPVVLQANFQDTSNVTHSCYDKSSYVRYWEKTLGPDWKSKININPDTNIMFCDVAKAYYIDKTLTKSQIQI